MPQVQHKRAELWHPFGCITESLLVPLRARNYQPGHLECALRGDISVCPAFAARKAGHGQRVESMESHETGFPPSTLFGNPFGIPTFPGLDDGIYVFSALSARTIRHRKGLVTDVSGPQRNACPGTLTP